MNYVESRPWGKFENLLDTTECKVKVITIKPNAAPSYQYHFKREEIWVVLQGTGELKPDGIVSQVDADSIIHVEFESKHQIRNVGKDDLIFIEVQRGTYFGEDDIVRLEDDYERD